CLGTLSQCQHEHRSEVARQETQYLRTDIAAARLADLVFEQPQPVLLVTLLGRGQCQEDLAFLACAALCQIAVNGGFGALVGQMPSPAPYVGCGRPSPLGDSFAPVVRHPTIMRVAPSNSSNALRRASGLVDAMLSGDIGCAP